MTSPELPTVIPGMIWDGVTEYQNVAPPGISYYRNGPWLCRMYGDGTRRFSESIGTGRPGSSCGSMASRAGMGSHRHRH